MLNENWKRRLEDYDLLNKKAIFIDNWFIYNFWEYKEENCNKTYDDFLNIVNKQDFYIIEGHTEVIFDHDKKNIKPLVKYCLWNIEDSREMKKIKLWLIMLWFLIFMIIINFIFLMMTKSVQNDILKQINLKTKIDQIKEKKVNNTTPKPKPIKTQNYIWGSGYKDLYHNN